MQSNLYRLLVVGILVIPGSVMGSCPADVYGQSTLSTVPVDGQCQAAVSVDVEAGASVTSGSLHVLAPEISFQSGFRVAAGGELRAGRNYSDASRFLTQATFGPTQVDIDYLAELGSYQAWLNEQFALSYEPQLPDMQELVTRMCWVQAGEYTDTYLSYPRKAVWWDQVINGNDQLRQRVAFALSEILVVSDIGPLGDFQYGMTDYWDTLAQHAFGNYRDLLEAVTLHPMMGEWLSHIRNRKADPVANIHPDENFAREMLQLFSIGLHELNLDGTLRLDASGELIPTYGQAQIKEFAKVYTGLIYAGIDPNEYWRGPWNGADATQPMVAHEVLHDTDAKTLLGGTVVPAGGDTLTDIRLALDNIFSHPNVAPFVSKQLIQRLVTSNPSPAYVQRVATVFRDSGGELQDVVQAILLDRDARRSTQTSSSFGKLREPILRSSHLWRAFGLNKKQRQGTLYNGQQCGQPAYSIYWMWWLSDLLRESGQDVLGSPSVFNFYQPGFMPSGPVGNAGLTGPEFQIATENWLTSVASTTNWQTNAGRWNESDWSYLQLDDEAPWGNNPEVMLKRFDLLLLNGQLSEEERSLLLPHLHSVLASPHGPQGSIEVVREAIILLMNSPSYLIQQ